MDRDTRMRDVSDKPGGRKGSAAKTIQHKNRSSHRPRPIDALTGKDQGSSSANAKAAMVNRKITLCPFTHNDRHVATFSLFVKTLYLHCSSWFPPTSLLCVC